MKWTDWLEVSANLASILTAGVAVYFGVRLWLRSRNNRLLIEDYLEKVWNDESGARVPMRIAAELNIPLEQVQSALNASSRVKTIPIRQEGSNRVDGLAYVHSRRG